LLAHDRWFSPGSPASSTTKTGRHDIAKILLKVALKHQKSKSNHDSEVETTDMDILTIPNMDNIQIRFTPVQVKINNDDTLLHN
jgi:hypothetical protein